MHATNNSFNAWISVVRIGEMLVIGVAMKAYHVPALANMSAVCTCRSWRLMKADCKSALLRLLACTNQPPTTGIYL
jgi:hypothetical protein